MEDIEWLSRNPVVMIIVWRWCGCLSWQSLNFISLAGAEAFDNTWVEFPFQKQISFRGWRQNVSYSQILFLTCIFIMSSPFFNLFLNTSSVALVALRVFSTINASFITCFDSSRKLNWPFFFNKRSLLLSLAVVLDIHIQWHLMELELLEMVTDLFGLCIWPNPPKWFFDPFSVFT